MEEALRKFPLTTSSGQVLSCPRLEALISRMSVAHVFSESIRLSCPCINSICKLDSVEAF